MTIGAAKRLKAGKATGVDVWDPAVLSGNSSDAAKANAKLEGVADKVRFETRRYPQADLSGKKLRRGDVRTGDP